MNVQLVTKHKSIDYSNFSSEAITSFLDGVIINAERLYHDIKAYINRFVYFVDERHLSLITTWVMGTYLFPVFRHYPYIWLNADKGSGKTTLLEVIKPICFNGQMLVSPTPSVLFREVDANRVTLLIDEFEGMTKQNPDLCSGIFDILNAGFNSEGTVKRAEGTANKQFQVRSYSAYSPKIFSGITTIDNVLRDRTIQVRLLRKGQSDKKERYKPCDELEATQRQLRDNCYIFALTHATEVAEAYQSNIIETKYLFHLNNRELDLWEPLFAIQLAIDPDGFLIFMEGLLGLSKEAFEEKYTEDLLGSDNHKLLLGLSALLTSDIAYKEHNEDTDAQPLKIYRADDVLTFLKTRPEMTLYGLDQKKITSKVRALGIETKQFRAYIKDGEKENYRPICYFLNETKINEYLACFPSVAS